MSQSDQKTPIPTMLPSPNHSPNNGSAFGDGGDELTIQVQIWPMKEQTKKSAVTSTRSDLRKKPMHPKTIVNQRNTRKPKNGENSGDGGDAGDARTLATRTASATPSAIIP